MNSECPAYTVVGKTSRIASLLAKCKLIDVLILVWWPTSGGWPTNRGPSLSLLLELNAKCAGKLTIFERCSIYGQ